MNENKIEIDKSVNGSVTGGERRQGDVVEIIRQLAQQGRVTLRVRGSSMLPWVRPDDVAVIHRAGIDDVRCGDVVLFQRESRLFVHRLVENRSTLRETQFLAKGDAHPGPDGMVNRELVLGRVMRIHRGDKRIDLDSPRHLALGLMISQLSRKSAYWYPVARTVALFIQFVRRLFAPFGTSENASE